ncbi:hypothetical protein AVEN_206455-1 [Araneus ventricosus]|uniref:Uncharacterized protein n=1 Tax=Araneus ventricosus TaxID=182803 RepID=A0A4Y2P3Z2_ARAVE|nr:hypothetical protein AVEN_206455-1 [Araneus ventricosus]
MQEGKDYIYKAPLAGKGRGGLVSASCKSEDRNGSKSHLSTSVEIESPVRSHENGFNTTRLAEGKILIQ